MNYTLVLYKSDGCNTCRGCVMEQWGSDFSLDTNVSGADAVNQIAAAFTRPSEGGGYTAYLIGAKNNETITHTFEQYCDWRHSVGGVSTYGTADDWEDLDGQEGKRLNQLIRTRVTEILDRRRMESEQNAAEQKQKEAKEQENNERQQLEALKQKYEGTK